MVDSIVSTLNVALRYLSKKNVIRLTPTHIYGESKVLNQQKQSVSYIVNILFECWNIILGKYFFLLRDNVGDLVMSLFVKLHFAVKESTDSLSLISYYVLSDWFAWIAVKKIEFNFWEVIFVDDVMISPQKNTKIRYFHQIK